MPSLSLGLSLGAIPTMARGGGEVLDPGPTTAEFVAAFYTAGGSYGPVYDFTDLSTMFQDSAGTIACTAEGQEVRRVLDQSEWGLHISCPAGRVAPKVARVPGKGCWGLFFDNPNDPEREDDGGVDLSETAPWITYEGSMATGVSLQLGLNSGATGYFGFGYYPLDTDETPMRPQVLLSFARFGPSRSDMLDPWCHIPESDTLDWAEGMTEIAIRGAGTATNHTNDPAQAVYWPQNNQFCVGLMTEKNTGGVSTGPYTTAFYKDSSAELIKSRSYSRSGSTTGNFTSITVGCRTNYLSSTLGPEDWEGCHGYFTRLMCANSSQMADGAATREYLARWLNGFAV